ncbi:MAG: type III toxin-antitoxin system ToxN/AbiQ family toxin [Clostridia bacterium]|nr:type III toxin-antitoxin system ToxN/AbiQ family toxin [Clostridia bacterium]
MENNKLNFYEVNDEYVEYLSKFDKNIMYTKVENRKFKRKYIGILFEIENNYYISPLSSYKSKHENMEDALDFIKIGDKAVINLNNMFPVKLENIKMVEIEKEPDEKYKELLRNEYSLCVPKFKQIVKNAKTLYRKVVIYKRSIKNRCCNFKLLEEKCQEYSNQK